MVRDHGRAWVLAGPVLVLVHLAQFLTWFLDSVQFLSSQIFFENKKNNNKIKENRISKKKEYKNFKNFLVYDLTYEIIILYLL